MSFKGRRDKFLLQMYQACWENITRAEDAAWKTIAAYAALFAGLSIAIPHVGVVVFVSIIILISFLAIALSLNANLWFVRNIGIISNLEKEFLDNTDYGSLIPTDFGNKIPFFSWKAEAWEAWWVLIVVYFGVCASVAVIFFPALADCNQRIFVAILFFASLMLTMLYGRSLKHRHDRFMADARGPITKQGP